MFVSRLRAFAGWRAQRLPLREKSGVSLAGYIAIAGLLALAILVLTRSHEPPPVRAFVGIADPP